MTTTTTRPAKATKAKVTYTDGTTKTWAEIVDVTGAYIDILDGIYDVLIEIANTRADKLNRSVTDSEEERCIERADNYAGHVAQPLRTDLIGKV